MDATRKLRRQLGYELAKLSGLQESVDATDVDTDTKELATQIREQAEACLRLLDQYQSSVPSRMWSDAERRCRPLRDDLKRIGIRFRAASGQWELRTDERLRGRSWWNSTRLSSPLAASSETAWILEDSDLSDAWTDETFVGPIGPIDVVLNDLAFDPDLRLLPEEPAQMMTLLTVLVGTPPEGGAEIFSATLCTPEWLAAHCASESFVPGGGLLIVRSEDFDEIRIRREVDRFLSRISEDTWPGVVTRIKEWFPSWEFDGYAP